jgi:NAD(P)-dependent dehydrogenase (short-subunit alcohol dehydrogenase family)
LRQRLAALGATVLESSAAAGDSADATVHNVGTAFAGSASTGAAFTGGPAVNGSDALLDSLEQTWVAVAEVANSSLIPSGRGGKVLLIAPSVDDGEFAPAARAALENLARTLSVEWARYRVTATMIAPADETSAAELAELVCYLVSDAGDYFSGCRFELSAAPT